MSVDVATIRLRILLLYLSCSHSTTTHTLQVMLKTKYKIFLSLIHFACLFLYFLCWFWMCGKYTNRLKRGRRLVKSYFAEEMCFHSNNDNNYEQAYKHNNSAKSVLFLCLSTQFNSLTPPVLLELLPPPPTQQVFYYGPLFTTKGPLLLQITKIWYSEDEKKSDGMCIAVSVPVKSSRPLC